MPVTIGRRNGSRSRQRGGVAARGAGQQPAMPVIGFLGPALDRRRHWLAEFGKGLGAEGFVEGQNVTIEYRSANGGAEGLPELATDLVRRQVAVIFASGPPAAAAAKRATQTIPIVFVSGGTPFKWVWFRASIGRAEMSQASTSWPPSW